MSSRLRLAAVAATALTMLSGAAVAADPESLSTDEIVLLQRRLTDAGCYSGPIDGQPSPATLEASGSCPDQDPLLRVEIGAHTGMIYRIGVDAACQRLVTGSEDKTVRVWSLPDGKLERVLRLPIGAGHGGKAYAVALSPDGRYVAVGGWDAAQEKTGTNAVTIVDLEIGEMARHGSFDNPVAHLAFSPDGRRVSIGLINDGLRVIDRDTGEELLADTDYAGNVYGNAFAPDGSVYATSYDGYVRRYGPDLQLEMKVAAPHDAGPYALAIDPSGQRLAIGYRDTTRVSILDAATLMPIAETEESPQDAETNLNKVAWSSDGKRLIAGGSATARFPDGARHRLLRTFTPDGQRTGGDAAVGNNTVMDLKACGGGVAFATADPGFGLLQADNTVQTLQAPKMADMRNKLGAAFTLSDDATVVGFGLGAGADQPVIFDLHAARLADASQAPSGMTGAVTDGLPVSDWIDSASPKLTGEPITIEAYELSRSLAIRRDHAGFVLGADWSLRAFDASGAELWNRAAPGAVFGVNLSSDGQIIVAAHADGTVRWYRWSDGSEILALFVEPTTKHWVAWTPSGYYTASPGGDDLVGWHLNRGWTQAPDFFPVSQLRERFERPDVVERILATLDESAAIRQADAASHRNPRATWAQLPLVVEIAHASFNGTEATLDYTVRSPSNLPVDSIEILIDGVPAEADSHASEPEAADGEGMRHVKVAVPRKGAELTLIAHSGPTASEPARVRVANAEEPSSPSAAGSNLYLLTIGVSDSSDPSRERAGKDAQDFAAAMSGQGGNAYTSVSVRQLIDHQATRSQVLDGLEWLRQQVGGADTGVAFLAGRSTGDGTDRVWSLPADPTQPQDSSAGLSRNDLRNALGHLAGKAVLYLDVCHVPGSGQTSIETASGRVDLDAMMEELALSDSGILVISSCTPRELSIDRPDDGNGPFTKALMEAIRRGKRS